MSTRCERLFHRSSAMAKRLFETIKPLTSHLGAINQLEKDGVGREGRTRRVLSHGFALKGSARRTYPR